MGISVHSLVTYRVFLRPGVTDAADGADGSGHKEHQCRMGSRVQVVQNCVGSKGVTTVAQRAAINFLGFYLDRWCCDPRLGQEV